MTTAKLFLVPILLLLFQFSSKAQQSIPQLPRSMLQEKTPFGIMDVSNEQSVASSNFDVHFYRCEWAVDPAKQYITGKVTTYFTITTAATAITFDLNKTLLVDSVLYHGFTLSYQQLATDALEVQFPNPLPQGQLDSVAIFYKGTPPNNGSFVQSSHNGTSVLWTLSEPYGAKDWWPCKDLLTDKADSIDIVITYPAAYQSSSNGILEGETIIGAEKQDYWKHRYPIASYLVAIAVTNYNIDHDSVQLPSRVMPVDMYAYPENATQFKAATTVAKAALQKFSSLLGEYPFSNERYAQTQFGWGGGMEHQTNTFIVAPDAGLVAHELAHQWFGDAVTTSSWQDIWLNEGFATYMAYINASSLAILRSWNNSITGAAKGGSVFVTDTTNVGRIFDGRLTYNKGAYVLHMLRWKLGDSVFFRGLRQYLNDPAVRFKSARTADLQRNMEQVSGQSLTKFFNDWIYGEGYPSYRAEWNITRTKAVRITLSQTTSHPSVSFFEMPVPLEFKNASRDTVITVNHTRNGEVFTVNLGFVPDTLLIDPQLWILSKDNLSVKKEADPEPTQVLIYPNPATNAVTVYLPASAMQNQSIMLFNALGQQVFSKKFTSGGNEEIIIPLYGVASGMYWVQVTDDNKNKTVKKLLVIKP